MGVVHIIAMIIGIFVVLLIFIPMLRVVSDTLVPTLKPNITDARGRHAVNIIEMAFLASPIVLIASLIIWALVAQQRREYRSTERPAFIFKNPVGGTSCLP